VDASKAGEGQLEISINDGDVPNAVQVLGGGKCLVTYTPEQPITHEIEVTFNGDQVTGAYKRKKAKTTKCLPFHLEIKSVVQRSSGGSLFKWRDGGKAFSSASADDVDVDVVVSSK